jgi:hypothetical protein
MADRYTKAVLTVIAAALVWIAARESTPSAGAQRFGQPVLIAGISTGAAKCLGGHVSYTKGDAGECVAGWCPTAGIALGSIGR